MDIRPMPVIMGSPRSGTTLLRLMLDSHPDLAIPPETGFLSVGKEIGGAGDELKENCFRTITHYPPDAPGWQDFKISRDEFRQRLQDLEPFSVADGFRLFYQMYAERFGKSRWGDKTPLYCRKLLYIEDLLPEARFIHLVRDGRDVAVSLRKQWFSPGHDIEIQAAYWRDNVLDARSQGAKCRHYLEVVFEDLIHHPEATLREICAFLKLDFSQQILKYHEHSRDRLAEHEERVMADGTMLVSKERRFRQQEATLETPNAKRINVWKNELSPADIQKFESVAGDLLVSAGYELSTSTT